MLALFCAEAAARPANGREGRPHVQHSALARMSSDVSLPTLRNATTLSRRMELEPSENVLAPGTLADSLGKSLLDDEKATGSEHLWAENDLADFVDDYKFADVTRYATNVCAARTCGKKDFETCVPETGYAFSEGLSAGFHGDCGEEYKYIDLHVFTNKTEEMGTWIKLGADIATDCNAACVPNGKKCTKNVKLNYGCWFTMPKHPSARRDSRGAAVNVGRSLRAKGRGAVAKALGLPCGRYPYCNLPNSPLDRLWCTAAQKLGYDSIQIRNPEDNEHATELVVCKGCGEAALNGACPPVELRRGSWDSRPGACNCSGKSDSLNCGDPEDFMQCRDD
jgi:hypothetical protein